MATIINQYTREFIQPSSFTDETTSLKIVNINRLAEPGYLTPPVRLWIGMSIYEPASFTEDTMGLPFIEIDLTGWGNQIPWDITIYLTEIRKMLGNYSNRDIYVYAKGLDRDNGNYYIHWQKCNVTMLIADSQPIFTVNPNYTINDSLTKTLSGNSNTIIRYVTDATINFTAEARKEGAIYGYTVRNGTQTEYKAVLYNPASTAGTATFYDCDSPVFSVVVEDNRGYTVENTITVPNFIEYFTPTIRIKAQAPSAVGGSTTVSAEGIVFNGSFGSQNNSVTVQCRYRPSISSTWSSWYSMTVNKDGNGYTASTAVTGLDYLSTYVFEGRIVDSINTVTSSQVSATAVPVFDWSEEDFNFNVPVNINGNFNINNETILRHTGDSTNNTVLSASGGHIYIRPGGTSTTDGEVKISPQGNVELKGNLTLTSGDITVNGIAFSAIVEALQNIGLLD